MTKALQLQDKVAVITGAASESGRNRTAVRGGGRTRFAAE